MCPFACMVADLAAMEDTELTVNPKLRSDSLESVYKDLIIPTVKAEVGSRVPD